MHPRSRREKFYRNRKASLVGINPVARKAHSVLTIKIYLLIVKAARRKITEKMLDKITQQLSSISVIQFVFTFNTLPIPSPCSIPTFPAHYHFKGEPLQPSQSPHYEVLLTATQNLSVSKHCLNSQLRLPSLTQCRKARCSSISVPILHYSSGMRAHSLLANLLLFNFVLQGSW